MKTIVSCLLLIVFSIGCICAQSEKYIPVVLVFPSKNATGATPELAESLTKSSRLYFKDTNRVESIIFSSESASVQRALLEKRLTDDNVASYSSNEEKIKITNELGYDFASSAEVSINDNVVNVYIWIGSVKGDKWEASSNSTINGSNTTDTNNALQSAASAAVIEVSRTAFENLPILDIAKPIEENQSIAITTTDTAPTRPTAQEIAQSAEQKIIDGQIAEGIDQYQKAVNEEPSNGELRIKLAEAYAARGLYRDAYSELGRAIMVGVDSKIVDNARDKIQKMESGQTIPPESVTGPIAEVVMADDDKKTETTTYPTPSPTQTEEGKTEVDVILPTTPQTSPSTAVNVTSPAVKKMIEGDKLWNEGKPDSAGEAYKEAIKLSPTDWRAYERLVVVNASMGLFGETSNALKELNKVQPNPDDATANNRYVMLRKAFDNHFAEVLRQYDRDLSLFNNEKISRESYFASLRGIAQKLDRMRDFLNTLSVPAAQKPANQRRSMATGLFKQACFSLMDYLETNEDDANTNADLFIRQAKKEFEAARKLDDNVVVLD